MEKYNLRSGKSESFVAPIQLQLSKDKDFLTNLDTDMAQQDSQVSSYSKVDYGELTSDLDGDDVGTKRRVFDWLEPTTSNTHANSDSNKDSQTLVIQQIQAHLSMINDRLTKLEEKDVKKTNDKSKI